MDQGVQEAELLLRGRKSPGAVGKEEVDGGGKGHWSMVLRSMQAHYSASLLEKESGKLEKMASLH